MQLQPKAMLLALTASALFSAPTLAQPSPHLSVIPWNGKPYDRTHPEAREAAAKAFYASHADAYDFLIVFPAFATGLTHEAGLQTHVRNDVSGIGLLPFDRSADFGSAGRLRGYIDIRALDPTESPLTVDEALGVVAHEIAHQWSAHVSFRDAATGQVRTDLLGADGAHWSFFLDSDASVLYGSDWQEDGIGKFKAVASEKRYSALDLYLMGFLAPSEVPPFTLIAPAGTPGHAATDVPPPDGTQIAGSAEQLTVGDIIAAEGARVPAAGAGPHVFRAAFILLVPPGSVPTAAQLAYVEAIRKQWVNTFFFLTRGRALMETDLIDVPPGPVAQNPGVGPGLDFLLAQQGASGQWADRPETRIRDTQSALEALSLFGSDPRVPAAVTSGGGALAQSTIDGVDAASRRALGLRAANMPPGMVSSVLDQHVLRAGLNGDQGYGYALGYGSSPSDSVLAGQALAATGAGAATLSALAGFVVAQQNLDGGWGWTAGGPGRIEPTARALSFLSQLPQSPQLSLAISRGASWLEARAQPDGAFQDDDRAPVATAFALMGLADAHRLTSATATNAATALLAMQLADGSWGESSHQTAQVLKALRIALAPNLTLDPSDVNLSAFSVTDGEHLSAQVTVRNTGFAASSGFTIRAFDSDGAPLSNGVSLPGLAAGLAATVTLTLDSTGHGGSTQAFFVVDPEGAIDEAREDDNRAALGLAIAPPPSGADLIVKQASVVTTPASISKLPQALSVTAEVANIGLTGVTSADVTLFVQSVPAATVTVALGPRSNSAVTFTTSVPFAQGQVELKVAVDPSQKVVEAREDNNETVHLVPVIPTVDVGIAGAVATPASLPQGLSAAIDFDVFNAGTQNAQPSVSVTLFDAAGAQIGTIEQFSVAIAAGSTVHHTTTWHAKVAGGLTAKVAAVAAGDVDPANDQGSTSFTVTPGTQPNLFIAAGGITTTPNPLLEGQPGQLNVRVENGGSVAAGAFDVDVYEGVPGSGGVLLGRAPVTGLAAGASTTVVLPYAPASAATVSIAARADPDNVVAELDETDNLSVQPVQPLSLPDLVLAAGDIASAPPFPASGTVAQVAISVLNAGGQQSASSSVDLYLGPPEAGGKLIGSSPLAAAPGGSRTQVTIPWDTTGLVGPQTLVAIVNATGSAPESNQANNRASRLVTVQNSALSLTAPYFSPNGDGSLDTTDIVYTLSQPDAVQVQIVDAAGKTVRMLSEQPAQSGNVTWDGRTATGQLAKDGPYDVIVSSGAPPTAFVGALKVVLDNNRSSVAEAAGTPLLYRESLETHLNAIAPLYARTVVALPNDTGVIFAADPSGTGDLNACGFYLQPLDGREPTKLTPVSLGCSMFDYPDYGIGLSPDGDKIAYFAQGVSLRVFSIASQSEIAVPLEPQGGTLVVPWQRGPELSPDGAHVAFIRRDVVPFVDQLDLLSLTTGSIQTVANPGDLIAEHTFSPDGGRLAFATEHQAVAVIDLLSGFITTLVPPQAFPGAGLRGSSRLAWSEDGQNLFFSPGGAAGVPVMIDVATAAQTPLGSEHWLSLVANRNGAGIGGVVRQELANTCAPFDFECPQVIFLPEEIHVRTPATAAAATLHVQPDGEEIAGLQWSPLGTFLVAHTGVLTAFETLGNLTNRFGAIRAPGGTQFVFRGTAADVNFDTYEVTVRPYPSGQQPLVVASGAGPVVDGVLATWAPPGAGIYEATVTVRDLAGNSLSRTAKVAWANTPAIANFTRSPRFISPNADGVQDTTTLEYDVVSPISTQIVIKNAQGHAVRHFPITHLAAGHVSRVFDGRDDLGVLLPDGVFTVELEGATVDIEVDRTPPVVDLALSTKLPPPSQKSDLVPGTAGAVVMGTQDSNPKRSVPLIEVALSHRSTDKNLKAWTVEASAKSSPTAFSVLQSGTDQATHSGTLLPWAVAGRYVKVRATDLAGNVAESSAIQPDETLNIVAVGDGLALLRQGALSVGGEGFPRFDSGPGEPFNTHFSSDPSGAHFDPGTGSENLFTFSPQLLGLVLVDTLSEPIVSYEVKWHSTAHGMTGVDPVTVLQHAIIWDARALPPDRYDLELRATTASGRVFSTPLTLQGPSPVSWTVCVWPAPLGVVASLNDGKPQGAPDGIASVDFSLRSDATGALQPTASIKDLSLLSECDYQLIADATRNDGTTFTDSVPVNICGLQVSAHAAGGSVLSLNVGETLRSPVASAVVLVRASGGGPWFPAGVLPAFTGNTSAVLPLPSSVTCGSYEVRIIGTSSDGTAFDTEAPNPNFHSCATPTTVTVPCAGLSVAPPARDGPAPLCSAWVPTWTAGITATGLTLSQLDAAVQLTSSTSTQPVPVTGFAPGGSAGTAVFSTQGASDGEYVVHANAVDVQGNPLSATSDKAHPIIVDTSPPLVSVTAPVAGQQVCPIRGNASDGSTRWTVDVSGGIADAHLEAYSILLRSSQSATFVPIHQTSFPSPVPVSIGGVLASADVTSLGADDFELLVQAQDVSGGSVCAGTSGGTFHLNRGLALSTVSSLPTLFSPDGDGVLDSSALSFTLNEPAQVTITAVGANGNAGTVVQGSFARGAQAIPFIGLAGGAPLPDGSFTLEVAATDACGNTDSRQALIEIDTTPPVARVDSPIGGEVVGSVLNVSGEASDAHLQSFELAIAAGSPPGAFTPVAQGGVNATGMLATVGVSAFAPGAYTLRLRAKDTVGHASTQFVPFTIGSDPLIQSVSVAPLFVSPNADGVQDSAVATVSLNVAATVTVTLVDASGAALATIDPPTARPAGPFLIAVPQAVLAGAGDGDRWVRVDATDGTQVATEKAPLVVDSVKPALAFSTPAANAWLKGDTLVAGSIKDAHLTSWQLAEVSATATTPVASGAANTSGTLGQLSGLSEGHHKLSLLASDAAGNQAQLELGFDVDVTVPLIAFVSPQDGELLTGAKGPVDLHVTLTEDHLDSIESFVADAPGGTPKLVSSLQALPSSGIAGSFDVAAEQDGAKRLTVQARDRAGNVAAASILVDVDNVPPVVVFTAPLGPWITAPFAIEGSIADSHLLSWVLELAPGANATSGFTALVTSGSVASGTLWKLTSLPPDGDYTLRLGATDRAKNAATTTLALRIDATPPSPPSSVVASRSGVSDAALAWQPSTSSDVITYEVRRALGAGPSSVAGTTTGAATQFLDPALADGSYAYTIIAIDAAGNRSAPSNVASLQLDATPPAAVILSPAPGARVSGLVDINGTAFSPTDFKEYRLFVGTGATPSTFTSLLASGLTVVNGKLGALDTGKLAQGSIQTVRLEAEDLSGNVASSSVTIEVDNTPPAAPVLTSATASGSDVALVWSPPAANDLEGCLVLRGGAIANAPTGASLSDVSAYLIPPGVTTFTDAQVPDGTHEYTVLAMDTAGNVSVPSNARSVTVETQAPSAHIAAPPPLARLSAPTTFIADTQDLDVASVQFEVRAAGGAFVPAGPPGTQFPWTQQIDPSTVGADTFAVRAVATDHSGKVDVSAEETFFFRDGPLTAPALTASVIQSDVMLSWTDSNSSGRVIGYDVLEGSSSLLAGSVGPQGTATATSTAQGTPAEAHDGDLYTSWRSSPGSGQRWELTFAQPEPISRVGLTATPHAILRVSLGVDGEWIPIERETSVDSSGAAALPLASWLYAGGVRVELLSSPSGDLSIDEIDLWVPEYVSAGPFTLVKPAGAHPFTVRALGRYGASAEAQATAVVYAPVLDAPPAVASSSPLAITGHGAKPYDVVSIYGNGALAQLATADGSGAFSASVALTPGVNALFADATDAAGNVSWPSNVVSVTYAPAPAAVVTLSLVSVAGSAVELVFTVTGSTSDVAGYELRRGPSGGALFARATAGAAVATFVDAPVPNGTWDYVVAPFNASGVYGAASNLVSATLSTAPPPAPSSLTVSAPATGQELGLSWLSSGGTTASFDVQRAQAAAGPFVSVGQTGATSWPDAPLTDGVTYFYRVLAVDSAGNASSPSNVASGTPQDQLPPTAPSLFAPTTPGAPITVSAPTVTVSGHAELGATVTLTRNGQLAGVATAAALEGVLTPYPLAYAPQTPLSFSAPGGLVAYGATVGNAAKVVVEELPSHVATVHAIPAGTVLTGTPVLSPDGAWVAVEVFSFFDYKVHVVVGSTKGTTLTRVATFSRTETAPAFSSDSRSLAYAVAQGSTVQLAIRDVANGTETVATPSAVLRRFQWSTTGDQLFAVLGSGPTGTLVRIDAVTLAELPIHSAAWTPPLLVGPGDAFALAGISNGATTELYRVEVSSGSTQQLTTGGFGQDVSLSPAGDEVAWTTGSAIRRLRLDTLVEQSVASTPGRIGYEPGGKLLFIDPGVAANTVELAGRFDVFGVALTPGANTLYATAQDAAGNNGPPSSPITVAFNTAGLADLAVSATTQPATPISGDPAQAAVTVSNQGAAPAGPFEVAVTHAASDGSLRVSPVSPVQGLAVGASMTLMVPIDTSGVTGAQTLVVVADGAGTIPDADPANNVAHVPFNVVSTGTVSLSVGAAPASIPATGSTLATVHLQSSGPAVNLDVSVDLVAPDGTVALTSPSQTYAPFASGASASFTRSFGATGLLAGAYTVFVRATSQGATVATAAAPLTIEEDRTTSLTLSMSKASYVSGEAIHFSSVVKNDSLNAFLLDATWTLELTDAVGTVVVTTTSAVPSLSLGASALRTHAVPAPGLPPGTYTATARVELDGAILAATSRTLAVVGIPAVVGQLSVQGAGAPPEVPQGTTLTLAAIVANQGTAAATNTAAHLVVFDAAGAMVASTSQAIGNLAPASSVSFQWSIPTAMLPVGTYAAGLYADHDGVFEALVTQPFLIGDSKAPVLTVKSPAPGAVVPAGAFVLVRARDDASGISGVWVVVDGAPAVPLGAISGTALDGEWGVGLTFATDGAHVLQIVASDGRGNVSTASISLISDTVPPVVAVLGVTEGALVNSPVTPTLAVTETNPSTSAMYLDGNPFAPGSQVTGQGAHTLVGTATDLAGNVGSATVHFTLDSLPPSISISGITDGAYVHVNVNPFVTVTDANLASSSILLDGSPFTSGTFVTAEGAHLLAVSASDLAGNTAQASIQFTIDKTPPNVSLTGFTDGALVNAPVTPVWSASDANLLSVTATLDGSPLQPGTGVTTEGPHAVVVTAFDRAGNQASASGMFEVDTTPPVISITGVADGTTYQGSVTPAFAATDLHPVVLSAMLDGAPFTSGTPVTQDGSHQLVVTATDAAGNVAGATVSFTVLSLHSALSGPAAGARVLALLRSERHDLSPAEVTRVSGWLAGQLAPSVLALHLETTETGFLTAFRSGRYNVVLLASLDQAAKDDGKGEATKEARRAVDVALTEAVHTGRVGVVGLWSRPPNRPAWRDFLGTDNQGQSQGTAAILNASAAGPATTLATGGAAIRLKLLGATAAGTFSPGSGAAPEVAQTLFTYGGGHAVAYGFDVSAAAPSSDAATALLGAISFVTPAASTPTNALAVDGFHLLLSTQGPGVTATVHTSVPPPLTGVLATAGGVASTSPPGYDWTLAVPSSASIGADFFVRLPDQTGSWSTVTSVFSGPGTTPVATHTTQVSCTKTGADLLADAVSAASALPSTGATKSKRDDILQALADVQARPVGTRADAELNLEDLSDAIEEAREVGGGGAAVRASLDELLRYWEARWFAL